MSRVDFTKILGNLTSEEAEKLGEAFHRTSNRTVAGLVENGARNPVENASVDAQTIKTR